MDGLHCFIRYFCLYEISAWVFRHTNDSSQDIFPATTFLQNNIISGSLVMSSRALLTISSLSLACSSGRFAFCSSRKIPLYISEYKICLLKQTLVLFCPAMLWKGATRMSSGNSDPTKSSSSNLSLFIFLHSSQQLPASGWKLGLTVVSPTSHLNTLAQYAQAVNSFYWSRHTTQGPGQRCSRQWLTTLNVFHLTSFFACLHI